MIGELADDVVCNAKRAVVLNLNEASVVFKKIELTETLSVILSSTSFYVMFDMHLPDDL